jgi:hypothetical protein
LVSSFSKVNLSRFNIALAIESQKSVMKLGRRTVRRKGHFQFTAKGMVGRRKSESWIVPIQSYLYCQRSALTTARHFPTFSFVCTLLQHCLPGQPAASIRSSTNVTAHKCVRPSIRRNHIKSFAPHAWKSPSCHFEVPCLSLLTLPSVANYTLGARLLLSVLCQAVR